MQSKALKPEEYFIREEPYYQPAGEEIAVNDISQLPIKVSDIYRRITT